MSKIIILSNIKLCPKGFFLKNNFFKKNLCDILIENNILINHFCEKFGKCTTCSITVKEGFFFLNEIEYEEFENLNKNFFLKKNIRLSCQSFLKKNKNIILKIND